MLIKRIKKNKIILLFVVFVILFSTCLVNINSLSAQNPDGLMWGTYQGQIQEATGLGSSDPRIVAANVIRIFLGFMGIILVLLIMYAGWLWMSSNGSEDKISKSKKILANSIIGLIIIMASFALASFILNKLYVASGSIGSERISGVRGIGGFGASGNQVINSHYPTRNQSGVNRNTPVIITFREPINAEDLIRGGAINTDNLVIFKTSDGSGGPFATNFSASASPDNRTFTFTQSSPYLGSNIEKVWYTVAIADTLRKADGTLAFGTLGDGGVGYYWSFEVGNVTDIEPPRVVSVIPMAGREEPRNVVIQINFNEAIYPQSGSGSTPGFNNIEVRANGSTVNGNFYISNEYKTIEFLTEQACGTNSCGKTVYCLPASSNIEVLVKAATLITPGEPMANSPYDGIVDMQGNSLDGNNNRSAEGPPTDNYIWSFTTNNNIDLSAPAITSIVPASFSTNVSLDADVVATFNKNMMSSSFVKNSPPGSGTVSLLANPASAEVNYWVSVHNSMLGSSQVKIGHNRFAQDASYMPEFNSGVKDIYQNCYNPSSGPGCVPNPPTQPYCCDGSLSATYCSP